MDGGRGGSFEQERRVEGACNVRERAIRRNETGIMIFRSIPLFSVLLSPSASPSRLAIALRYSTAQLDSNEPELRICIFVLAQKTTKSNMAVPRPRILMLPGSVYRSTFPVSQATESLSFQLHAKCLYFLVSPVVRPSRPRTALIYSTPSAVRNWEQSEKRLQRTSI